MGHVLQTHAGQEISQIDAPVPAAPEFQSRILGQTRPADRHEVHGADHWHHDGFCLFDSKVSDYTAVKSPAKRDFVAEYVEACRRHGMRVGL